eukprot:scaffold76921_cov63-Phaeocystis_antarctica.AAC.1
MARAARLRRLSAGVGMWHASAARAWSVHEVACAFHQVVRKDDGKFEVTFTPRKPVDGSD